MSVEITVAIGNVMAVIGENRLEASRDLNLDGAIDALDITRAERIMAGLR